MRTDNQAERVVTLANNGYNLLRRNFLPKIPSNFAKLQSQPKSPGGLFRNEIITLSVGGNSG